MKYRLSGQYYTAPDRGAPDGFWYDFSEPFEDEDDNSALASAKSYLSLRYANFDPEKELRGIKLVRYEEVNIDSLFT